MAPSHGHSHAHPPDHHGHDHPGHVHHSHDPAAPHPAQAVAWSILHMTLAGRLAAAAVISAGLWAFVWLAMR